MATNLNANRVETAARELLDSRIQAVRSLATARQAREDKRAELDQAERADAAAYTAAQRAGWTTDELRRVGLDQPTRRSPGRPRNPRTPGAHQPTD